ncbi:site-specific tyrosine recombinase XerD, partial [Listeria monocytogenes]|nr:site-specific tyrosine recombinase XerD [Listeria monocytogenes]
MNEQIIDYLHYLTIERGLSQNTRASYQRDLQQYLAFLQKKQVTQWQQIDRVIVLSFLQSLQEAGKSSA